jgi:hypothetical protein
MAQILSLAGLKLERVVVHAIEDNTFRAVLKLINQAGENTELDARPSDAIALALRTDSSIWMLEEVVADASISVDAEADAEDQEDFRRFLDRTSPAELIRHLHKAAPEGSLPDGEDGEDGEEKADDSHGKGSEEGPGAPDDGDSPS